VVVDLGVREVAAILAQDDEVLQALFLRLDLGKLDLCLVLFLTGLLQTRLSHRHP
jgi:hypothetical protein